jgi:hypothetical protein
LTCRKEGGNTQCRDYKGERGRKNKGEEGNNGRRKQDPTRGFVLRLLLSSYNQEEKSKNKSRNIKSPPTKNRKKKELYTRRNDKWLE